MKTRIENPILPGFHPDPSVCRVGNDFYLACSSFTFYPGVPLFHSVDLCNWEQIGYALHRPEMVNLNPDVISYGIWAPTLRYHNGLFYLIVGNWSTGEVLLLTAKDAKGPWREQLISGIGGDPSLFFDEDGRVYCTYSKSSLIHMTEIDPEKACTLGEPRVLWSGFAAKAPSPEASHIYKKKRLVLSHDRRRGHRALPCGMRRPEPGGVGPLRSLQGKSHSHPPESEL